MFGLENKKRKNDKSTLFDLEVDLASPKKKREIVAKIQERMGQLKSCLREGQDKEKFDEVAALLQGYAALSKVVGRFGTKAR